MDVLQISAFKGRPRSHRSLIQDTARAPSISVYPASPKEEDPMQVCVLEEGDTWMTPYRRYIADGILPAEPEEGKKIKRNSAWYPRGWSTVQTRVHALDLDMRKRR